jgi:Fe-S cluster assembly protein SufD
MAFEERIDVHAELHDVRTAAKKNFEIKVSQPKKEEEIHLVKYHLKK